MKKNKEKRIALKLFLSIIYIIIITILFVCSFKLFKEDKKILSYSEVKSVEEYTYIDISQMSEKFAFYEEKNIGIHFVINKEDTGVWHTYLIAIDEKDYNKYKDIIDYTYERVEKIPEPIRVYGYPVVVDQELKDLAIKNIKNFLPKENEVEITNDNYETYLTNSYLDTTQSKKNSFNTIQCISFGLIFVVLFLLILTIIDKDKTDIDKIETKK